MNAHGHRSALALAVVLAVFAAAAPSALGKTFGGLVPDIPTGGHGPRSAVAHIARLGYGGGPVLHSNRTHVIFWQPSGSGLGFDPSYASLIETFLARVASDQRKPTNVYGLSGQYSDSGGPAAYSSRFGGAVVDTSPLPSTDCTEPPLTGPGWFVCLQDADLIAEIQHVIAVDHLPRARRDVYFLVTPSGFGSCQSTGPDNCALGGTAPGSYCGYHSSTPDGRILYAVIPYNAVSGHCQSDGNPRPNGGTADPTISTLSHEHNEIVTDPLGNGWIDSGGNENGDLCATNYGPNLGGSGVGAWNQVIGGGHYYLQEEWSNDDGSCQSRDESDRASFSGPARVATGRALSLRGHAHDSDGRIVAYRWFFGDGHSAHHRVVSHAFKRPGVYRVVLRITDSAGNWAFSARTIGVSKAGKRQGRR